MKILKESTENNLYLYHATDKHNLPSILEKGLLVKPNRHNWEGMYTDDNIFLAVDCTVAEDYMAGWDEPLDDEDIVILKVSLNNLNPKYIYYDWNNRCEYHEDINSIAYRKDIPAKDLQVVKDWYSEPAQDIEDFEGTDLYEIIMDTFYNEVETNQED